MSVVRCQTLSGTKSSRNSTIRAFRLPAELDLNCLSEDCPAACQMSFPLTFYTVCGRTRRDRYLPVIGLFCTVQKKHAADQNAHGLIL